MNIKEEIRLLIKESLIKLNINDNNIILEVPNDKKNGDYSSNIAMQLASSLKKNPREIALSIISNINKTNNIDKIEIAGPGFINFYLKKESLLNIINEVLEQGDNYGRSNIGLGKKINVEFASVNPTGVIHLGHARCSAYGDSLCRILSFAGYNVTREYYINDGGNQIDNMGLSIKERYRGLCGMKENMPKDGYYGNEIKDIALSIYNKYQDSYLNKDNDYFKNYGLEILLEGIKNDLLKYRVSFDIWTSEKKIREAGLIEQSLSKLKELDLTYVKDDALWIKTSNYGDEKDRVLIKNNGEYAYFAPDIAYHLDKLNRGYDNLINVFGADHHGYVPRLKAAIEGLGYDKNKLDVKIVQMVRLMRGSEEVRMSKRTGNVITVNDLIDEVGLNETRYFFAMRNIESQMDFDYDLAIKKSHDNPVYYVSYAHARICSLLEDQNIVNVDEYRTINSDYAYDILSKISEFKSVVEEASNKKLPHLITNYVYDLANLLHIYYNHERILAEDEIYKNERLLLISAVKIVLNNALKLIGVEAPRKM